MNELVWNAYFHARRVYVNIFGRRVGVGALAEYRIDPTVESIPYTLSRAVIYF